MVRINLLPVRQVKKREFGRQMLVLFGTVIVLVGVVNYIWYSLRDGKRDEMQRRVVQLQNEIKALDRVIGEVQNITREQKALEDKLRVLDTLKRGRTGPVRLLDAIASILPKKVWVASVMETGGSMTIEGTALGHEELAELLRGMQNVVWTAKGIGRIVEGRPGAKSSRVELLVSGTIEDFPVDNVASFFTAVELKRAAQAGDEKTKVVNFTITCAANYAT